MFKLLDFVLFLDGRAKYHEKFVSFFSLSSEDVSKTVSPGRETLRINNNINLGFRNKPLLTREYCR